MSNVKLAVIGGSFLVGEMLYECLKPLPVDRVAVCARPEETDRLTRQYACGTPYTDYRELLEREHPRVVLVFPQAEDTGPIVRDCLKSGAYVFAERPICRTVAEARALTALQQETGCYVMPRYNRRCAPAYQMAKEILGRPEFGSPGLFYASYHAFPFESEDAMLWIHISHILDALIHLLGDLALLHAAKVDRGPGRTCFDLTLATAGGAVGTVQSAFTQCFENPVERVSITGDGRYVEIDNIRSLTYHRPSPQRKGGGPPDLSDGGDALCWKQNNSQMTLFSYYGFEGCLAEIVAAAAENRPPAFHMEDAARTVALLCDIERRLPSHG